MNELMELAGLAGSLCFAFGSWPQAWQAWKNKKVEGVSLLFTSLCFTGGLCSSVYAVMTGQYVMLPNFVAGALGIAVVIYYQLKSGRSR